MIKILKQINGEFFVLNDGTHCRDINGLILKLSELHDGVCEVDLKKLAKDIYKDCYTILHDERYLIMSLGQGGAKAVGLLNNYQLSSRVIKMKCHRLYDQKCYRFVDDFDSFDFRDKEVILFEDVIASGETILYASKKIKEKGGAIKCILSLTISGASPCIKKSEAFPSIVVGATLNCEKNEQNVRSLSAHWVPGIYSLRHLLYGEEENPAFYSIIADLYFHGKDIKKLLTAYR